MAMTPHRATCTVCRTQVMVDHVSHRGDIFLIWHSSATARRCPGTDKPAVPAAGLVGRAA
jgi:hypothetical protein